MTLTHITTLLLKASLGIGTLSMWFGYYCLCLFIGCNGLFISLIKFIHLLFVVGLLGSTFLCLILVGSRKFSLTPLPARDYITRLNISMLLMSLFIVVTGTFLVLPKHFTFHTPWIQAAYLLTVIYIVCIAVLILLKKYRLVKDESGKIPKSKQFLWRLAYIFLLLLLILVVHDAVTKTTLFF